jgi:pimeloyl-ACP methyl ester carboxylesterase
MTPCVPVILAVCACQAIYVPTKIWQVAPEARQIGSSSFQRTRDRAVLLVPGMSLHPLKPALTTQPEFHSWQVPNSDLVCTLSKDADVYSFAYGQTTSLDCIAQSQRLRDSVAAIRILGYKEIVLIGHSAGGLIGRLFVEANPDSGITKLIMVSTPHQGSDRANINNGYPKSQAAFIKSLTPEARLAVPPQPLDGKLEIVSVISKLNRTQGDGLVKIQSQWPEEYRQQGVPAVLVIGAHTEAMSSSAAVKAISELAREKLTRWSQEEVEMARRSLFRHTDERRSFFLRRP